MVHFTYHTCESVGLLTLIYKEVFASVFHLEAATASGVNVLQKFLTAGRLELSSHYHSRQFAANQASEKIGTVTVSWYKTRSSFSTMLKHCIHVTCSTDVVVAPAACHH